jgi:hypothetical protein
LLAITKVNLDKNLIESFFALEMIYFQSFTQMSSTNIAWLYYSLASAFKSFQPLSKFQRRSERNEEKLAKAPVKTLPSHNRIFQAIGFSRRFSIHCLHSQAHHTKQTKKSIRLFFVLFSIFVSFYANSSKS